jgi:hypothetical protein
MLMRRSTFVGVLALLAVVFMAGVASAMVITFDDLTAPATAEGNLGPIPDGYAGFNWSDYFYVMEADTTTYNPSGYINGVVSAENVAFNAYAASVSVDPATTFDFTGAWLTAAWNDDLNITVEGWLSGVSVYSNTVVAQCTFPQWFEFDYLGIDTLTFNSFGGTDHGFGWSGEHFVMDNLVVSGSKVVPEPASIMSLFAGLALLGGYRLRRKS